MGIIILRAFMLFGVDALVAVIVWARMLLALDAGGFEDGHG